MDRKKIVLVVASQGYQPVEYGQTREVLEAADIHVIVASDQEGTAAASDGSSTSVDLIIPKLNPADFDGIVLIGGPGALSCLDTDECHTVLQQAAAANKLVGAICISPRILARAGVLKGKRATGWNDDNELPTIFDMYGVEYEKSNIVTDGLFVTATGPAASQDFGNAIIRVMLESL